MTKTDAAILMVDRALNAGIRADYVLMDTWFTTEPLIMPVLTGAGCYRHGEAAQTALQL